MPFRARDFLANAKKAENRVKPPKDFGVDRRLPEATARDVSPSAPLEDHLCALVLTNVSRVEPFAGAACLTTVADMHRAETNNVGLLGTTQSGSPPAGREFPRSIRRAILGVLRHTDLFSDGRKQIFDPLAIREIDHESG